MALSSRAVARSLRRAGLPGLNLTRDERRYRIALEPRETGRHDPDGKQAGCYACACAWHLWIVVPPMDSQQKLWIAAASWYASKARFSH